MESLSKSAPQPLHANFDALLTHTARQIDQKMVQIYKIYVPKTSLTTLSLQQKDKVLKHTLSYQTQTPSVLKAIGQCLAKIGWSNRYSLQEELILLRRIEKAIPILQKDESELAKSALQSLREGKSFADLPSPQKMLIAIAIKDWNFLCQLGEEANDFAHPGSLKECLFTPNYTQREVEEAWQIAIYECISDQTSTFTVFQKLVDIGKKNRIWNVNNQPFTERSTNRKIERDFGKYYLFSGTYGMTTMIQAALLHNRPKIVDYIQKKYPLYICFNDKKLFNHLYTDAYLKLIAISYRFDTIRAFSPDTANKKFNEICQRTDFEGLQSQKALLKQKSLVKEERERLEQLVSLWVPQRDLVPPNRNFSFTFSNQTYQCNRDALKNCSTWAENIFADKEVGHSLALPTTSSAGPYLQKLIDHAEGVEEIDPTDPMYSYFGITQFTPKYTRKPAPLVNSQKQILPQE